MLRRSKYSVSLIGLTQVGICHLQQLVLFFSRLDLCALALQLVLLPTILQWLRSDINQEMRLWYSIIWRKLGPKRMQVLLPKQRTRQTECCDQQNKRLTVSLSLSLPPSLSYLLHPSFTLPTSPFSLWCRSLSLSISLSPFIFLFASLSPGCLPPTFSKASLSGGEWNESLTGE